MPKKKRNFGSFLKKIGMGGLAIAAELDPTGIAKKVTKLIPGMDSLVEDEGLTDEEVFNRLKAQDPNFAIKLRELEAAEFKAKVDALMAYEEAETERLRIGVEDTKSARQMRIETGSKFTEWLTAGTAIAVFLLLTGLIFFDVPEGNVQIINIGFGSILTVFVGCYKFFTGSSSGSKSKDSTMDRLLNGSTSFFTPKGNV